MNKIAQFEKVSYEQFRKDWIDCFPQYNESKIKEIYNAIKLPKRATSGSAGYDFFSPISTTIWSSGAQELIKGGGGQCITESGITLIPTGIRCQIEEGWVLQIFPRSGLGFKYGLQLANTVGIIDSDYYNSDNEGHIFVKFINDSAFHKNVPLAAGQAFCQGVFTPFGITYTDDTQAVRNGGFGSTDKK
ncbi:MAG: deoxyuridine 5'-triphosphate nucleotidohydrolase [Ruminococcaceae bacterium]|nr:deoxyuridine 5'-triphosphate nucleotidohydrolase [Oscillospiraceae bacterium]